jgi:ribosomal-protein-alanine N-acetyltransferase
MSAVPQSLPRLLLPMTPLQLDAVLAIETAAYAFPWSRGNFVDSIASGYAASVLYDGAGQILGYFVAMAGVDEMHLLNITVAPQAQHRGHALYMLDALVSQCRERGAVQLWLEVRESNARARAIYLRRGFVHVGVRKGYYPAPQGQRENAAVMSLAIPGGGDGLD